MIEIGVDRGVSFMTLVTFLVRSQPAFLALGVDVMVQEQVRIVLDNLDRTAEQQAYLVEENSLQLMPKLVQQGLKFDLLLLDGDHNYPTVVQEAALFDDLVRPGGIVIVDDYDGKWSERDLWYAERPGYEHVKGCTPRDDSHRHAGVKPTIDEWLVANPTWELTKPMAGEPVVLRRRHI